MEAWPRLSKHVAKQEECEDPYDYGHYQTIPSSPVLNHLRKTVDARESI